jgi:elongation factor 2
MPAARKGFYAAKLMSKPALQEPIFSVEFTCPATAIPDIQIRLKSNRGNIFEEIPIFSTQLVKCRAFLPASESFRFKYFLRKATSGQEYPQYVFDHWETVDGDPLEIGSKANQLILEIRKSKHAKVETPSIQDFLDTL